MKVSIDGFRRNLVSSFNDLLTELCENAQTTDFDGQRLRILINKEDFIDRFNSLASNVDGWNYCFIPDTDFQVLENNDTKDVEKTLNYYLELE